MSTASKIHSFRDDNVIGYSVDCVSRRIDIRFSSPDGQDGDITTLVFAAVEGYQLRDDAFGNIVFDLSEVSVDEVIDTFWNEITESFRMSGAPGPWASDLSSAPKRLSETGVRGYVLSSSMGLSGWLLAKRASVLTEPQHA